jgi:DNA processing protein
MLGERGYVVVTGLARGVDEEATLGALKAGGHVVAVLPYLLEESGILSSRAKWLLHTAAKYSAIASVVAENLVEDAKRVRAWLVARNKIITRLATALIVPEARFKRVGWGTRHAVEYTISMRRPVVVLEPRVGYSDVVKAFEHFKRLGALAVKDVGEALSIIARRCNR